MKVIYNGKMMLILKSTADILKLIAVIDNMELVECISLMLAMFKLYSGWVWTLPFKINWPSGSKLIENQGNQHGHFMFKKLTYWWNDVVKLGEEITNTRKV